MDQVQERFERAVGDDFVRWYNAVNGTAFTFSGRAGEAPDLVYRDGETPLHIEVSAAYYDDAEAALRWKNLRLRPDAPDRGSGINPDESLVAHINDVLAKKVAKAYGAACVLVLYVSPPVTTAEELEALLPRPMLPAGHSFEGVYLAGDFRVTRDSIGGYRVWRLA